MIVNIEKLLSVMDDSFEAIFKEKKYEDVRRVV